MVKRGLLALGTIIGLFVLNSASTSAKDIDFSVDLVDSSTIVLPSTPVNLLIEPTANGSFSSDSLSVRVYSNVPTGYQLLMTTSSVDLVSSTANPTTGTFPSIPTLSSTASQSNFELNKWGISLDGTNYLPMSSSSTIADTTSVGGITNGATTTINIATKLDLDTAPGTYSTTINFSLVVPPRPSGFEASYAAAGKSKISTPKGMYYTMQDMSASICTMTVADSEIQVADTRDNKLYWILKARDGNCWMTQNLDHDIVTTPGYYTPANTDITENWTPANATLVANEDGTAADGWEDNETEPYSVDVGDWYYTDTRVENSEIYDRLTEEEGSSFSKTPFEGNGEHGHIGNYYNWSAAVAMNDTSEYEYQTYYDPLANPQTSICPKGWKLPVITEHYDIPDDYLKLAGSYANNTDSDAPITSSPLYFIRSGYFDNYGGYVSDLGQEGHYWSPTVYEQSYVRELRFFYSSITTGDDKPTGYGLSIRCVAYGEPNTVDTFDEAFQKANKTKATANDGHDYYQMQDMTTSICNSVTAPTAADYSDTPESQLVDNRDGKTYWVAKLKDGKCWMTQNLDHDIVTTPDYYTPANTDITENWTPSNATIIASIEDVVNSVRYDYSLPGWIESDTEPSSIDVGDWYWTDTWYGDEGIVDDYLTGEDNEWFRSTPFPGNGEHGHIGNHYNWTAAIATNDSSSYYSSSHMVFDFSLAPQTSICPKGWKLPLITGTDETAINGLNDFDNIINRYGNNNEDDKDLTAAPLYYVRGGHVIHSSMLEVGYSGAYWSNTVRNGQEAYALEIDLQEPWPRPDDYKVRDHGFSVRCVAR